jgi:YidC/Oxa1 family membrane protein insertase
LAEGFTMFAFVPFDAVLSVGYHLVSGLAGTLGPAPAVVAATAAVRLLLVPLTLRQVRAERARAALAPELAKLREKHGDDTTTLARETLALHRSAGVGMFAGIGPALVQLPFFLVLYRLFVSPSIAGIPNDLLGHAFFGVGLAERFAYGHAVFWVLLAILTALAWWTSRRMRGVAIPALRFLPYGTVLVAMTVPLAAGLYLVTTTAWTAVENAILRRPPEQSRPEQSGQDNDQRA